MQTTRKITDNIFYIGVSDKRLALFENLFPLDNGVSYNSYFINDEKTAVLDTVDRFVSDQYFENIQYLLQGKSLDYLIVHHMEPDHGANISRLMEYYPNMQVVGNVKIKQMMGQFFDCDLEGRFITVKEGDTLCLGQHTLSFIMAPMVHWPEVMMSYEQSQKILFTADAFGSFGAMEGIIFNDEADLGQNWVNEARRYYCNIVGKFGPQVQAALKKVSTLDVKIIAPLHGLIWRSNLEAFLEKYDLWSRYIPEEKGVLIAYASMYGNTENAANALANSLAEKGIKNLAVKDVSKVDISYLIALAFQYSHIVIASPTYNLNLYPKIEHFLVDMKALNLQNRTVGLIENSSWAPTVIKQATELLQSMKNMTIMEEQVVIKSALKDNRAIEAMATKIAQEIL